MSSTKFVQKKLAKQFSSTLLIPENELVEQPPVSLRTKKNPETGEDLERLTARSRIAVPPSEPISSAQKSSTRNGSISLPANDSSLPGIGSHNTKEDSISISRHANTKNVHMTTHVSFVQPSCEFRRMEVGLDNLGNTCFMNASLQCLLHIYPLVSFFLDENVEHSLNFSSPMKGILAQSFCNLVRDVFSTSTPGSSVSPVQFQKAVCYLAPHLLDFQQQDCQEFLRFLLDGMSEDLCRSPPVRVRGSSVCAPATATGTEPLSLSGTSTPSKQPAPSTKTLVLPAINSPSSSSAAQGQGHGQAGSAPIASAKIPDRLRGLTQNHRDIAFITPGEEVGGSAAPSSSSSSSSGALSSRRLQQQQQAGLQPIGDDEPAVATERDERDTARQTAAVLAPSTVARAAASRNKAAQTSSNNFNWSDQAITGDPAVDEADPTTREVVESSDNRGPSDKLLPELISSHSSLSMAGNNIVSAVVNSVTNALSTATTPLKMTAPLSLQPQPVTEPVERTAQTAWDCYLRLNDSVITDLFAGQLQSTIECSICKFKSRCFDPFLDLSVPIPKGPESRSFLGRRQSADLANCGLEECLERFSGEEVLEGENGVTCDRCKVKRKCTKRLSIYRYPRVLVIHIKRFRFNNISREKLSTDVNFPLRGLDLSPYLSPDRVPVGGAGDSPIGLGLPPPVYDLTGVSNHCGGLNGGHYVAHVDTHEGAADRGSRWMCFNDSKVTTAAAHNMSGPSAYVLFYRLRNDSCGYKLPVRKSESSLACHEGEASAGGGGGYARTNNNNNNNEHC